MAQRSLSREARPPIPSPSSQEQAFIALLRTADMLRWRLSEVIEPHDITITQFNVLRILREHRDTGLPTLEIGARMVEQAPGITRLVDRLEHAGLVRRERTRLDRRQVLCHIEPKGLKLLSWLDASVPQATEVLFSDLKPGEVEKLIETLDSVRKACAARSPSLRKR